MAETGKCGFIQKSNGQPCTKNRAEGKRYCKTHQRIFDTQGPPSKSSAGSGVTASSGRRKATVPKIGGGKFINSDDDDYSDDDDESSESGAGEPLVILSKWVFRTPGVPDPDGDLKMMRILGVEKTFMKVPNADLLNVPFPEATRINLEWRPEPFFDLPSRPTLAEIWKATEQIIGDTDLKFNLEGLIATPGDPTLVTIKLSQRV